MKARKNKADVVGRAGHDPATYGLKGPPSNDTNASDSAASAKVLRVRSPRAAQTNEPESSVLQKVQEALWACGGVLVFRNNVGAIKKGRRYVRFGLGVGSADLVCVVAPHGRLLAIETKRPKGYEATEEQEKWLTRVRQYGGIAAVVRSPDEVYDLVEKARKAVPW